MYCFNQETRFSRITVLFYIFSLQSHIETGVHKTYRCALGVGTAIVVVEILVDYISSNISEPHKLK